MILTEEEQKLILHAIGLFHPKFSQEQPPSPVSRAYQKVPLGAEFLSTEELLSIAYFVARFKSSVDPNKNPPLIQKLSSIDKKITELLDKQADRDARRVYGDFLLGKIQERLDSPE